jgi:DNA repair protein RecO (recombination protein O)
MPRPPRIYKTPAIVLRQRKLGERDKIITLFSAEFGKLEAVAKGVRRVTSRLAGSVEPLGHAFFMIARGRSLDVVTQVQPIETFQPLRCDLDRLSRAIYAAELVDRSTEERADNFALYKLLLQTLRRLSSEAALDLTLRHFEISLLDQLGYRPALDHCVSCSTVVDGEGTRFAPALGGAICSSCRPPDTPVFGLSNEALSALRVLQGGDLHELHSLAVDASLAGEIERVLRQAIHYAFERDVRSAAFVETVRRGARGLGGTGPPNGA